MEVFVKSRGSVKRLLSSFVPSFIALWSAVVVLFAAMSVTAGGPFHKVDLVLVVHDANGYSIPKFEAMLYTYHEGYVRWQSGREGRIHFGATDVQSLWLRNDPQFQVIVRAPGLAPAILNLEDTGAYMERTVSLTPGRLIELSVRTADGRPIPKDVIPLVVFTDYADWVRPMRQPQNIRPGRVIDFEMSKIHRVDKGRFRFRVPDETLPFFLAIHQPGFMRSIESEVIGEDELADGRIEWQLPTPARLRVRFDFPAAGDHPRYDFSSIQIASYIPDVAKYYTVWLQKQYDNLSFDATLDDLPPNDYLLLLRLAPPEHEGLSRTGDATRPYWDRVQFSLSAGEEKTIDLNYAAFDPNSWRGSATATVAVKNYGGEPAADSSYTLSYAVPHYNSVIVKQGDLDAAGRFQLEDVRPGPDGPEFFLKVGNEGLGRMQMTEKGSQNFEFTLAPRVEDRAPDVTLVDVQTGRTLSLRSLRGNIVYLEFWATWCGPCKTPMAKLNAVTKKRRGDWGDRVEVLAVSIDNSKDVVYPYVKRRGWTHVQHFWTGESGRTGFKGPAAEKFGVKGIPTAILIDPQGVIIWRGHPRDRNCEMQIEELLR